MASIDVVELEPAVIEVANRCAPVSHDALDLGSPQALRGRAHRLLVAELTQQVFGDGLLCVAPLEEVEAQPVEALPDTLRGIFAARGRGEERMTR